ncbi:NAD-glutamate dehydrogenase [Kocuria dechangensis]|uniref:NAD-glutamate dehydrogenase n=1 Tax=Kocuria dechangensis TaxID=1176249 RepID=A0A917H0P7_9MICC|nr:NAD-glutamate dehydrogenase [Kocuria dechangensis]GGG63781.1 NAD-glutamate dehydrogenase [Kocuria dechangensis]
MAPDQFTIPEEERTEVLRVLEAPPRWEGEQEWINEYYRHVPQEDLLQRTQEQLRVRADHHWEVGRVRAPGESAVGVHREEGASVVFVVTEDVPYLVSTVTAEIAAKWGGARLVIHPVLVAARDRGNHELQKLQPLPDFSASASGDTSALPSLAAFQADGNTSQTVESWISVELLRPLTDRTEQQLVGRLTGLLEDVHRISRDQSKLRHRVKLLALDLEELEELELPGGGRPPLVRPSQEFLHWLLDGNFILMGFKEYDLEDSAEGLSLVSHPETGLGLLQEHGDQPHRQVLTGLGRAHAREAGTLFVTKANRRSSIHRREYLDYIGVAKYDAEGRIVGEYLVLGLFSRRAYNTPARETPLIKEKMAEVAARFGFLEDSHSARDLMSNIEDYPRDELFHMTADELYDTMRGVMGLDERRQTRLFLRQDHFGRFMSAVVFLPRDRYNTSVRGRIEAELSKTFDAEEIDFDARLTSSTLARLFFRIRLPYTGEVRTFDRQALEARLRAAVRSWPEALARAIHRSFPEALAREYVENWAEAFPDAYRADYEIEEAVQDLQRCEDLWGRDPNLPAEVRVVETPEGVRLNIYLTRFLSLTELLPMLQHLGLTVLDQKPYEVQPADGREFQLYDFGVRLPEGVDAKGHGGAKTEDLIEDTLCAVLSGRTESDSLNRLVLPERMAWRSVAVLRSYVRYLLQLGHPNSFDYISDTLLAFPAVTRALTGYFDESFNPDHDDAVRESQRDAAHARLLRALDDVPTLDADKLLRALAEVMAATLRTNVYQQRPTMAFKLSPRRISSAPLPHPMFEIWVWSPRVEGTHLRFGPVARGGLRWSDRREDFRTEVLGLVKAQMVKNAVIVPNGAKGGFYPKRLPDPAVDRDAWVTEGRESYKLFIASLLDLTDNLVRDEAGHDVVVHPDRVVRRDGQDSYLVVAADKGTASFSDTANAISAEYGFWLGDAFASGGSVGYDHKAMGITARGAWESVKRHFFELGLDTQAEDFTVVGVGDMSGDVFGNGMLLSEHIKLVAAFDHRDIFLDPDPDPAVSYAERERLFGLPRSSWKDYDAAKISEGGGIYPRTAKSVPVSPQVREALGLEEDVEELSPIALMQAILTAPADLLYNGGIGTYVKSSQESHTDVGDKANDAIRVNGAQLRARVVGEGGNLGCTQLGRVEAALNGVLLNTDAIDNSGGVESSDREVNIKILVDRMVVAGELGADERAGFIEAMTDEVAGLVLDTNEAQNVLLTTERARVANLTETYVRLMHWLEENADLDRSIEFLPSDEELHERLRTGQSLTSPELSVLTAYAKIQLSEALVESDLAEDPWFGQVLERYFPAQITEQFGELVDTHPLRKEIIGTLVANQMINYGGIPFAQRVIDDTSYDAVDVARAFVAAAQIYEIDRFAHQHRELPAGVPTELWSRMFLDMRRLLDRVVRWLLDRQETARPIGEVVDRYKPIVDLRHGEERLLGEDSAARDAATAEMAQRQGVPPKLALEWSQLLDAFALLDVARLGQGAARATGGEVDPEHAKTIAKVYFLLYDRYRIDSLLNRITELPQSTRWETLARMSMREDVYSTVVALADQALEAPGGTAQEKVDAWEKQNEARLSRLRTVLGEIEAESTGEPAAELASLSVALRTMRSALGK